MIEVLVTCSGETVASAEAETPEGALLAARTLWDEHLEYVNTYGTRHFMTVYFLVNGTLSCMVERRRP